MKIDGSSQNSTTANLETLGLTGTPAAVEYVGNFIKIYFEMKGSILGPVVKRKPTEQDVGHFCKAAWTAFSMQLAPDEYLRPLILKYQRMPEKQLFPQPHQLSSKFAVSVVEAERIKKVEQLPSLRAEELAKENFRVKIDQDKDYQRFIQEFEEQPLDQIKDSEFKLSYCSMRECQTWGEVSAFLVRLQEEASTKNLWRQCE